MKEELEQLQEEKLNDEPVNGAELTVSPKEQERIEFERLIKSTNDRRLELMEECPVIEFADMDFNKWLNKDWVVNNMRVWISLYINTLQIVNIKNPILIRKNQETVLERDKIINDAREKGEDTTGFEQSRAATLDFIDKLKDQIQSETFKLEEFQETINSLQNLVDILN